MKLALRTIVVVAIVCAAYGCTGPSGSGFNVTEFKDGKATRTSSVETYATNNIPCNVDVRDGKLFWSVRLDNNSGKRVFTTGILTLQTDANVIIDIEFSCTVEANMTGFEIGQQGIAFNDLPKTWKVTNKNVLIVPGAGCETPTTHKAGNWPKTELKFTQRVTPVVPVMVSEAPVVPGVKSEKETITSGAKIISITNKVCDWEVTITNSTLKDIIIDVAILCSGTDKNESILETRSMDRTAKVASFKTVVISGRSSFGKECSGYKVDAKTTKVTFTK